MRLRLDFVPILLQRMVLHARDALYLLTVWLLTLWWMIMNYPLWEERQPRRKRRYKTLHRWLLFTKALLHNENYEQAITERNDRKCQAHTNWKRVLHWITYRQEQTYSLGTEARSALFRKAWPHICKWRLEDTRAAKLQAVHRHYVKKIFDGFRVATTWNPWFYLMKKDTSLWIRARKAIHDGRLHGAEIHLANDWLYLQTNHCDLFEEINLRLADWEWERSDQIYQLDPQRIRKPWEELGMSMTTYIRLQKEQ